MDCFLCKKNMQEIDFRDTFLLRNYVSGLGKIRAKDKTGLCATHQRHVARAVKRARTLGLLSPTAK